MFLVSDAMATVGGPDQFDLYGQHVHLEEGRLTNAEGNFAGAHITQAEGVARLVECIGVPLEQALRMAITIPSHVVARNDLPQLIGRHTRDLLMLPKKQSKPRTLADAHAEMLAHDAAE